MFKRLLAWLRHEDQSGKYVSSHPYTVTVVYDVEGTLYTYEKDFEYYRIHDTSDLFFGGIHEYTAKSYALDFAERVRKTGLSFEITGTTYMYPTYQVREITIGPTGEEQGQEERQVG